MNSLFLFFFLSLSLSLSLTHTHKIGRKNAEDSHCVPTVARVSLFLHRKACTRVTLPVAGQLLWPSRRTTPLTFHRSSEALNSSRSARGRAQDARYCKR